MNAPPIEVPWDPSDDEIAALVERIDRENREAGCGPMSAALRERVFTTIAFLSRRSGDPDTTLQ